jgi:hypothetical protein
MMGHLALERGNRSRHDRDDVIDALIDKASD